MKNILLSVSCLVVVAMVACQAAPKRAPGTTGTAGTTGAAGTTAAAGTTGAAGTTAAAGTTGAAGTTAAAGTTGAAGDSSAAGTTGAAGTTAAAGTTGAAGTTAAAGTTGAAGTTAAAGATGAAGTGPCVPGPTTGAGGGTGNACANTMWTFTPTAICANPPNPACGFCGNAMTGTCAPKNAIDGNVATRYTSGQAQVGTEQFVLSFAAPVSVTGIKLDSSGSPTDATTSYLAEYSLDGTTFQTWCPPLAGPGATTSDIVFPARITVKALRISQTGTSAAAKWWSLQEVTVDGCQMP
jgi:F5/8 type C domain